MFSLFKKNDDDELREANNKPDTLAARAYKNQTDFIPFFTHYSPDTILTKNGELLRIIKISGNKSGLNYESGQGGHHTLRSVIRRAIGQSVQSDKFSFWIHTLRRRTPVSYDSTYTQAFADYVSKKRREQHDWKYQYYNEIYVVILHDGQSAELIDKKNLKQVIFPLKNRVHRNSYLEQSYEALNKTANDVVNLIHSQYDARYLSVYERMADESTGLHGKSIFHSEPLEFLGILTNLRADPYPMANDFMHNSLANCRLTFGYNVLETRNDEGEKRFAGILSIKKYQDISPETADHILQSPIELIISQSFHFTPYQLVLKQYRNQKMIFEMGDDDEALIKTGLQAKFAANHKKPTDYGMQQTNVMVLTDELSQLDAEISKAQQMFANVGIIAVREDIKLEEAYWSQMPGNFEFIRRQDPVISSEIAGFCRLNLFPNGTSKNNHWGDALTLIPTTVNSPYFFNFHYQDNGHSVFVDYNSFQDPSALILLNLLVTTSLKYQPRLYIFDYGQSSRLYVDKIEGKYHLFPFGADKKNGHGLNPFLLEDNARNQSFLLAWCCSLIDAQHTITDHQKEILRQAIAELFSTGTHRSLDAFIEKVNAMDAGLAQAFAPYHDKGPFAGLFDAAYENVTLDSMIQAFDISEKMHTAKIAVPLFSYLMHRIITQLDGKPTIIVLHNAIKLLENDFFAPRLESLLEMLKQNNVIVISYIRHTPQIEAMQSMQTLMQCCATRIYTPDDISFTYTSDMLGLSNYDSRMLKRMDRQKGEFLLKQHEDSIGLRLNLDTMDDIKAILAGDVKNLIAAGGAFAKLPEFH